VEAEYKKGVPRKPIGRSIGYWLIKAKSNWKNLKRIVYMKVSLSIEINPADTENW